MLKHCKSIIMKRIYVTPNASVEEFVANECVAVCYEVACKIGSNKNAPQYNAPDGNHWSSPAKGNDCHNHEGSCGNAGNNFIEVDNVGSLTNVDVWENNNEQGKIYGKVDYVVDKNGNGKCDVGDVIYWYTLSGDGNRRWNHWGYATAVDPAHVNRS